MLETLPIAAVSSEMYLVLRSSEMCGTWLGCFKINIAEPPDCVRWLCLVQDVMQQWISSRLHQIKKKPPEKLCTSKYFGCVISVSPSVCYPVQMEQLGSHRTDFREI